HDENARALRMHAGRADLVINGLSPTLLPAFEGAPDLVVGSRRGANVTYLLPRTDRGPLADPDLRRAIAGAIDRERAARTLFAGRATAGTTLLPPAHWGYSPDAPKEPPRTTRSRLLHGAQVRLTLLTSTDRLRGAIARAVAQDLADAGVEVEVIALE